MSTQVEAMPGSAARHTTSRGFVLVAAVFAALGTDLLAAHRGDLLIEDPRHCGGTAAGTNWAANLLVLITFLSLIQALGRSWTFWM